MGQLAVFAACLLLSLSMSPKLRVEVQALAPNDAFFADFEVLSVRQYTAEETELSCQVSSLGTFKAWVKDRIVVGIRPILAIGTNDSNRFGSYYCVVDPPVGPNRYRTHLLVLTEMPLNNRTIEVTTEWHRFVPLTCTIATRSGTSVYKWYRYNDVAYRFEEIPRKNSNQLLLYVTELNQQHGSGFTYYKCADPASPSTYQSFKAIKDSDYLTIDGRMTNVFKHSMKAIPVDVASVPISITPKSTVALECHKVNSSDSPMWYFRSSNTLSPDSYSDLSTRGGVKIQDNPDYSVLWVKNFDANNKGYYRCDVGDKRKYAFLDIREESHIQLNIIIKEALPLSHKAPMSSLDRTEMYTLLELYSGYIDGDALVICHITGSPNVTKLVLVREGILDRCDREFKLANIVYCHPDVLYSVSKWQCRAIVKNSTTGEEKTYVKRLSFINVEPASASLTIRYNNVRFSSNNYIYVQRGGAASIDCMVAFNVKKSLYPWRYEFNMIGRPRLPHYVKVVGRTFLLTEIPETLNDTGVVCSLWPKNTSMIATLGVPQIYFHLIVFTLPDKPNILVTMKDGTNGSRIIRNSDTVELQQNGSAVELTCTLLNYDPKADRNHDTDRYLDWVECKNDSCLYAEREAGSSTEVSGMEKRLEGNKATLLVQASFAQKTFMCVASRPYTIGLKSHRQMQSLSVKALIQTMPDRPSIFVTMKDNTNFSQIINDSETVELRRNGPPVELTCTLRSYDSKVDKTHGTDRYLDWVKCKNYKCLYAERHAGSANKVSGMVKRLVGNMVTLVVKTSYVLNSGFFMCVAVRSFTNASGDRDLIVTSLSVKALVLIKPGESDGSKKYAAIRVSQSMSGDIEFDCYFVGYPYPNLEITRRDRKKRDIRLESPRWIQQFNSTYYSNLDSSIYGSGISYKLPRENIGSDSAKGTYVCTAVNALGSAEVASTWFI